MRNWSWIVDFNIIISIVLIFEPLLILIWGECFPLHKISSLSLRTHIWLGYLHDILWLFRIVHSNCWGTDHILLTLRKLHLYDRFLNLFLILIWGGGFPHICLPHCHFSSVNLTGGFRVGVLQLNSTWCDQFICH